MIETSCIARFPRWPFGQSCTTGQIEAGFRGPGLKVFFLDDFAIFQATQINVKVTNIAERGTLTSSSGSLLAFSTKWTAWNRGRQKIHVFLKTKMEFSWENMESTNDPWLEKVKFRSFCSTQVPLISICHFGQQLEEHVLTSESSPSQPQSVSIDSDPSDLSLDSKK